MVRILLPLITRTRKPSLEDRGELKGAEPNGSRSRSGPPRDTHGADLLLRARADGRENLPESSAPEPVEVEAELIRSHEQQHLDCAERTRNELRELAGSFHTLEEQLPRHEDLAVAVEQAAADLERDLAAADELIPLRQDQQLRRRDLRHFMREHKLRREAQYPTSRILHFAIAALIVLVESVCNLGFFAPMSDLGMLGGFLLALGVSLANVATGFAAGFYLLRGLHHGRVIVQRLAMAGFTLYVLFALTFNLAVAKLRDLGSENSEAQHSLVSELLRNPLDVTPQSLALLALGLIASALALAKGHSLDDVVPGYGDRHRRFRSAAEALESGKANLRQRMLTKADGVPGACQLIVRRAEDLIERLETTAGRAEQVLDSYETTRSQLEGRLHVLLRTYRVENGAIRTAAVPAYFSTYPGLPSQTNCSLLARFGDRLGVAHRTLDELKAEAYRIDLQQAERVRTAAERFEGSMDAQMSRADSGRGDGSTDQNTLGELTRGARS